MPRGMSPRPRIVSTASLTAAGAVSAVRPWALADERGQDRVHAVVLGFSDLGRAAFEELILSGIAGDFGKPKLTIVDADPLGVRRLIDRDMPEIEISADIEIATYDPLTLTAQHGPLAMAAAAVPVTLVVIAFDDPAATMAAMLSIARMQEADGHAVATALAITEGQTALLDLAKPAGRPRDLARTWIVMGGIDSDPDILDLVTHRSDILAERIHATYCNRFGGSGPASQPWEHLRETYRKANRRAAAHLPLKLWTLGLREARRLAGPLRGRSPHLRERHHALRVEHLRGRTPSPALTDRA